MMSIQKKDRPKYLNLLQIRLPIAGILSIGHRVSGVILLICIPFFIYLLHLSLRSDQGFSATVDILDAPMTKLLLFFLLWALTHHFFAGIRFLLLDIDIGFERSQARLSAWLVFFLEVIMVLVLTVGLL